VEYVILYYKGVIKMKRHYNEGDRVYVSGAVYYGDTAYRVACNGTVVEDRGDGLVQIILDEVDGDWNVDLFVLDKDIMGYEKDCKIMLDSFNNS
jgi:hypothetical protein